MPDPQMNVIPPDGNPDGDPNSQLDTDAIGGTAMPDDSKMESLLLAHAKTRACPPPDLLFAAEEDVLPAAAGASIRDHAAHCALCQTLLAELDPAKAAFSPGADARIRSRVHAPVHARSGSTRKPTFWLSIAAAAAVLLVGVLGLLSYRLSHFSAGQSTVAMNRPPAPPAADFPELHQITPLAPPDDVPVLVTRGATATHGPSADDLMPAFRAYNRNDFARAAAAFAPLVARFPHSDIPPLYLGVSQLQLGQNAEAERSLAQAYSLTGSAGHDAATWYLAIADLRLHQSRAAVSLLWDLCAKQPNPYAARACALAQQVGPS